MAYVASDLTEARSAGRPIGRRWKRWGHFVCLSDEARPRVATRQRQLAALRASLVLLAAWQGNLLEG